VFSYVYMKILESTPRFYDRGVNLVSLGRRDEVLREIVSTWVEEGARVLDVGCGTGALVEMAASRGAKVVGLDASEKMLAAARERVRRFGRGDRVELIHGDVMDMDRLLEDDAFDLVVCSLVLSELRGDERDYVLRQCRRVLRDGGVLVVADEAVPRGRLERAVYAAARFPFLLITLLVAGESTKGLRDPAELLERNGFRPLLEKRMGLGSFVLAAARKEGGPPAPFVPGDKSLPPWKAVLAPLVEYLFRWFPFPVEPGLRKVGEAGRASPVLVAANYSLTEKRLRKALRGMDYYLLLVPTRGINNWCSAAEGTFNAGAVCAAAKAAHLDELVDHRLMILPQLAAPGVSAVEVRKRIGWKVSFGPVRAEDIPRYLGEGKKTADMRLYRLDPSYGLELALAMNFQYYLPVVFLLAYRKKEALPGFTALFWSLTLTSYLFFHRLPTRYGWIKALVNGVLHGAGAALFAAARGKGARGAAGNALLSLLLASILGMDMAGITGELKDEPLLLLYRLGVRKLGPFTVHPMEEPVLEEEKCIGCGACVDVCPMGVYELDEAAGKTRRLRLEKCTLCRACLRQCPSGALR
jgi:ubiquinone/menaquinone biosynthesis C-methylase UbiE/NAD-dependent dihydropyrimidine dehydrogenase PreA subunit